MYDENWRLLAAGIVRQAGIDYINYLIDKKSASRDTTLIDAHIKRLEKFFNSEWCWALSEIEGEAIIKLLRQRADEEYIRRETMIF